MQPLLNIGMRAARRAGDLIVRSLSRLDSLKIDTKGRNDFVTDVDRKAEAEIIATIRRSSSRPRVSRRGERPQRRQRIRLDHRSARRHDEFPARLSDFRRIDRRASTAGACSTRSSTIPCARSSSPHRAATAHSSRARRSASARQRTLEGSLIGTGFPYRMEAAHVDDYLAMLKVVMAAAAGVRRPGAAALDLAYVAAGRIDGFWEFGLAPWDTAAGTLLIQEAGGRVGTPTGAEYALGPNIVAGNPKVYQGLLDALGPLDAGGPARLSRPWPGGARGRPLALSGRNPPGGAGGCCDSRR